MKVKVEGFKNAIDVLIQMPAHLQKNVIVGALRKSAKPSQEAVKQNVPIDTGQLKEAIKIVRYNERGDSRSQMSVAIRPSFYRKKKNKDGTRSKINSYYGRFVHEGTKRGIKPNPYVEKGYAQAGGTIGPTFGDDLAKGVNSYVNRRYKKLI